MSEQDPRPLKSAGDTPGELVSALQALGRDRDGARLARVAQSLGETLASSGAAATGGASGVGGGVGVGLGLSWTKLGLLGLALGVGAWALLSDSHGPEPTAPGMQAPTAKPPAPVAAEATPQAAPAQAKQAQAAEVAAAETARPLHGPSAAQSSKHLLERSRDGRARAADATSVAAQDKALKAQASAPTSASASASAPAPEQARAEAQPSPSQVQEKTKPAASPAPPLPSPPPSEVALLQQARKAAVKQPEAALRLLDQHAARFPNGMLVPERELLAIEVLRRLGREAEAERRLQRFEAQYPESIHRRRLERSTSSPEER